MPASRVVITYCRLGDMCALCWQRRMGDRLQPLPPSEWGRIFSSKKKGDDDAPDLPNHTGVITVPS